MLARYEHVGQAVSDAGRHADLGHVEAPRLDQTEGVVDIAPDALTKRLLKHPSLHRLPFDIRHYRTVSVRELHLARLGRIVG
jgi:hypothetical protein